MSCVEHYFENLLFYNHDINDNLNKQELTEEQQRTIEECANYVMYTLFNGREELENYLNK